jgi:hypothetical protein
MRERNGQRDQESYTIAVHQIELIIRRDTTCKPPASRHWQMGGRYAEIMHVAQNVGANKC